MYVRDILKARPGEAVTVAPDDTVATAAGRIDDSRKGLALVCDADGALLGIISVIDINRAVAKNPARVSTMAVREAMNSAVVVCAPGERVEEALDKMTGHRIRHLPVVEDGVVRGVIGIRDLLECRCDEAEMTAQELQRYIYGAGYH